MDALGVRWVGRKALPESGIQQTPEGLGRIARIRIRGVSGYPLREITEGDSGVKSTRRRC